MRFRNGEWVGNPVRASIAALPPPRERYAGREGPLRLLVLGGSQGAQSLNAALPEVLRRRGARLAGRSAPSMRRETFRAGARGLHAREHRSRRRAVRGRHGRRVRVGRSGDLPLRRADARRARRRRRAGDPGAVSACGRRSPDAQRRSDGRRRRRAARRRGRRFRQAARRRVRGRSAIARSCSRMAEAARTLAKPRRRHSASPTSASRCAA